MGAVGVVTVWLALATTLFSGTGPVGPAPEPRACVASTTPPSEDVRVDRVLDAGPYDHAGIRRNEEGRSLGVAELISNCGRIQRKGRR